MSGLESKFQVVARNQHVYTMPESLGSDIKSVTMVELTAEEELQATKMARNDPMKLAYELVKRSIIEINDVKVNVGDGSVDTAWNKMGPKVRTLILSAYQDLHNPPEDAAQDFLKSKKLRA